MQSLINWLYNLGMHRVKPGLERISKILKKLGNPHLKINTIHITGTNGKGSTSAILSYILTSHGLKTGLYTSPHLTKLNERFKIDGRDIPDERLEYFLREIKNLVKDETVTFFEVTTALAFLYFYEEKVDLAVIECGMGGRLDATNVIKPLVSIITNVGLDHTKYLGQSLEDIAKEKAGIIKKNTPFILGNINPCLIKIFEEKAQKFNTSFYLLGKDFKIKKTSNGWDYEGTKKYSNLTLNLKGTYQGENLGCALKALEVLEEKKILNIDETSLKDGLRKVVWKGRYQKIYLGDKEIVLDVAHNLDGIKALAKTLEDDNFKDFTLLIGITNEDKNKPFLEMLKILLPFCKKLFLCEFPSPKKIVSIKDWKKALETLELLPEQFYFTSPLEAFKKALEENNTKVLITGSIYFVGQLLSILEN